MSFLWFLYTFQSPQNISGIKSSQFWSFTEDIYLSPWKIFQTTIITGFPDSSVGKESACSAGDPGSIPESGRSAGERIGYPPVFSGFPVAQLVKNLPAMWETRVQLLGWEDSLEKGTATHTSSLAWRIQSPIQSMVSQRVRQDWVLELLLFFHYRTISSQG